MNKRRRWKAKGRRLMERRIDQVLMGRDIAWSFGGRDDVRAFLRDLIPGGFHQAMRDIREAQAIELQDASTGGVQ